MYRDVTAAVSDIEETLSEPSLDPSDCLSWMTSSENAEMASALYEGLKSLQQIGVFAVNHQPSKKSD